LNAPFLKQAGYQESEMIEMTEEFMSEIQILKLILFLYPMRTPCKIAVAVR
jgi:hypothetical protein